MKAEVKNIIEEYLNFSGDRKSAEFIKLFKKVNDALGEALKEKDKEAMFKLYYVAQKVKTGLIASLKYEEIGVIIDDTWDDLEKYYESQSKLWQGKDLGKLRRKNKADDLGKLVDEGEVPTSRSRADNYWADKTKVIFTPNNKQIRSGADIPASYDYDNIDYLEEHYNLKAIEFGNWLSQQDRKNYLAGLGLSLFDLHRILGFTPRQMSLKGKISVAFGARGRGSALAHFEPDTFAINITRYSRPKKGSTLRPNFDRTKLLTASGGIGSFAHEFGHALDYFAGTFIEKTKAGAVSDGRSLRTRPNKKLMEKNSVGGLMEKLLYKIIFNEKGKFSTYYARLQSKKSRLTDYYFRRNELFARAFEVYVHYKMAKKRYRNIFLAETKYSPDIYLTGQEMKKLEGDFDRLISAIRKHI